MFKLENFENELLAEMSRKLSFNQKDNQFSINKLANAAEHLNTAAEIFEDVGMNKQAEVVINLLEKIAHNEDPDFFNIKSLSDKELNNLLNRVKEEMHDRDFAPESEEFVFESKLFPEGSRPLMVDDKDLDKTASVESFKKIKKDLKDSDLSSKELSSLKKMIQEMEESQDSSHLDDSSKKKVNTKKLVKNLKQTGTLFSKKEYK